MSASFVDRLPFRLATGTVWWASWEIVGLSPSGEVMQLAAIHKSVRQSDHVRWVCAALIQQIVLRGGTPLRYPVQLDTLNRFDQMGVVNCIGDAHSLYSKRNFTTGPELNEVNRF